MIANGISVSQCAAFSGLATNELVLGVTPSVKHAQIYSSYLRNLGNDRGAVQEVIVAAIRAYIERGAMRPAADLLIVLRMLLSEESDMALFRRGVTAFPEKVAPIRLQTKKNRRRSRALGALDAASVAAEPKARKGDVLSLNAYRRLR
jgi:hypothetical protein